MSHATDWRCHSCRQVLSHVRDGVLLLLVLAQTVGGEPPKRPFTTLDPQY